MAQSSALNSGRLVEDYTSRDDIVKKEEEVIVKLESLECLVCITRTRECFDIYTHNTTASGASLHQFIVKYTQSAAVFSDSCSKVVCKGCYDLINILEQAEAEYVKLKDTFVSMISKNPLFEIVPNDVHSEVKNETLRNEEDSEDEPLSRTKKSNQKNVKSVKKKKRIATSKKKQKNVDSWACDECDANGDTGGSLSLAAHKLTMHTLPPETTIKTEVGSQSPYNNCLLEETMQIEFDQFDDDNDSTYHPGEFIVEIEKPKKVKKITERKPRSKQMHACDQCNARYSSLARLESHKQKHDGSKPPYICEVCGAHYKHKRACDIHIALHKGISDWKCEECNKLFPSKNALHRHNNIHTGKLNYQCDLCGKSFIHTSSFKMHKLTHSGVKPHSCDVCGLALMTRSHLKRHKRIHSGEKRHECTVCGKRFSERYNLAAHQKSHEPTTAPAAAAEPRRRLFRCHFCADRFERRYMLERHMAVVHGRTLERPPPTPRNTMSKLLKQRAQRHDTQIEQESSEAKDERSSESRTPAAPAPPSKLLAQLSSSSSIITAGAWNGAYAAEFGIRPDFPH